MPVPSALGESVRELIDAFPGVSEHPAGHSQYLLRYKAPGGASFAVQRVEITSVRFWVLGNETFAALAGMIGPAATLHTPPSKGKPGRNSNLDQIPEFKFRPLHWVPVSSPGQAISLIGLLVASTVKTPETDAEPETVEGTAPAPLPEHPVEPAPEPAAEMPEAPPAVEETTPAAPVVSLAKQEPPVPEAPAVEVPAMQTHAAPPPSAPGPSPAPSFPRRAPRRGLLAGIINAVLRRASGR